MQRASYPSPQAVPQTILDLTLQRIYFIFENTTPVCFFSNTLYPL